MSNPWPSTMQKAKIQNPTMRKCERFPKSFLGRIRVLGRQANLAVYFLCLAAKEKCYEPSFFPFFNMPSQLQEEKPPYLWGSWSLIYRSDLLC